MVIVVVVVGVAVVIVDVMDRIFIRNSYLYGNELALEIPR